MKQILGFQILRVVKLLASILSPRMVYFFQLFEVELHTLQINQIIQEFQLDMWKPNLNLGFPNSQFCISTTIASY